MRWQPVAVGYVPPPVPQATKRRRQTPQGENLAELDHGKRARHASNWAGPQVISGYVRNGQKEVRFLGFNDYSGLTRKAEFNANEIYIRPRNIRSPPPGLYHGD